MRLVDLEGFKFDLSGLAYILPTDVLTTGEYFMRQLRELPSAEPEQQWIPCSERLPDHNQRVAVSMFTPYKGAQVRSGTYYHKCFMNDNGDVWNDTDEEVLAWMPLPIPYQEN